MVLKFVTFRKMENYKEAEWSAMSELEKDMQQLEAHLGEHFGDEDGRTFK